ncbi:MAG TPA: hypothetical protein VM684_01575 [Gaiellales bacterium]|nr:hypothetical protein [Gaiellales bacterium]
MLGALGSVLALVPTDLTALLGVACNAGDLLTTPQPGGSRDVTAPVDALKVLGQIARNLVGPNGVLPTGGKIKLLHYRQSSAGTGASATPGSATRHPSPVIAFAHAGGIHPGAIGFGAGVTPVPLDNGHAISPTSDSGSAAGGFHWPFTKASPGTKIILILLALSWALVLGTKSYRFARRQIRLHSWA